MPISAARNRTNIGTYENKTRKYIPNITHQKILNRIADSQQGKMPSRPSAIAALYVCSAILPHLRIVENLPMQSHGCVIPYNGTMPNESGHHNTLKAMAACSFARARQNTQPDNRLAPALHSRQKRIVPEEPNSGSRLIHKIGHGAANALFHGMRAFNELAKAYDPLRFPAADAIPPGPIFSYPSSSHWDNKAHLYVVEDTLQKNNIINSLSNFLAIKGQLNAREADVFANLTKKKAADFPILIIPLIESEQQRSRTKRISETDRNRYIGEHIKEHCAFEIEVLNTNGENAGKVLIFKAQRAENPFRMMYDDTEEPPSPAMRNIASWLNTATDIITIGLKPLIGNIIANNYRKEYYQSIGDEICATRQDHLTIAELATSLNVEGLAFSRRGNVRMAKPREMLRTVPLSDRAAYTLRNPATGVQQEVLIKLASDKKAVSAVGGGDNIIYLKPADNGEFVTYRGHPDSSGLPERRVIADEENFTWRYSDDADAAPLNVQIEGGKTFVHLQGEKHELQMNRHQQFVAVVNTLSGEKSTCPFIGSCCPKIGI
ncbi:hypothetical protein ABK905_21370 [Acerihabitans sp. KWT182]|uniref:Uncharacterized protein n=1 Tax=Acerihabitans sp. KWT182 TaxID=3157919 RepID=A0AAU7Q7N6_9GAMM